MSNRSVRLFKTGIVASVILGLTVVAGYFYWQYQQLSSNNPEKEIQAISKQLRKFMDLPESPLPTMATVTEKEKLQQQDFFQKAENGDKVLIYLSEGKAILFRPSTGKVIDVAPIRETTTPEQAAKPESTDSKQPESEAEETVSITLYNGSTVSGVTRSVESDLSELSYDYEVVARTNAARTTYTETVVVDVDGNLNEQAQELAKLLDASVTSLPSGERRPSSGGLLVIIGGPVTASPEASPAAPQPQQ